MNALRVFTHVIAASIWIGGHLVLAVSLLPEVLAHRDTAALLAYERVFERIGLPAMAVQVVSGLLLAFKWRPNLSAWTNLDDPIAVTIWLKLACLAATVGLAVHARLFIIPRLDSGRLSLLAVHILAVTTLSLVFAWLGIAFRFGGVQ